VIEHNNFKSEKYLSSLPIERGSWRPSPLSASLPCVHLLQRRCKSMRGDHYMLATSRHGSSVCHEALIKPVNPWRFLGVLFRVSWSLNIQSNIWLHICQKYFSKFRKPNFNTLKCWTNILKTLEWCIEMLNIKIKIKIAKSHALPMKRFCRTE
jgi:hypothetical protein